MFTAMFASVWRAWQEPQRVQIQKQKQARPQQQMQARKPQKQRTLARRTLLKPHPRPRLDGWPQALPWLPPLLGRMQQRRWARPLLAAGLGADSPAARLVMKIANAVALVGARMQHQTARPALAALHPILLAFRRAAGLAPLAAPLAPPLANGGQ